jgi:spermine/spermidine synthase
MGSDAAVQTAEPATPKSRLDAARSRLILQSFLMLFLELALIRWTASNILYLAYFTNFVLLASFLGIGLGFLRAARTRDSSPLAPVALAGLVAFVLLFPVQVTRLAGGHLVRGLLGMPALPAWVTLPVVFGGTVVAMMLVAEGVARTFVLFPPLDAYRLDIVGSIAGIVAFSALSFLGAPPVAWGIVVSLAFVLLWRGRLRLLQRFAIGGVVLMLALESLVPVYQWSPYYKLAVGHRAPGGTIGVSVNGIPHQAIVPLVRLRAALPFYFRPYTHLGSNPLDDVLIVGAGTGNDVAVALSQGASHVDAVEIDPRLERIGRDLHPDRPYRSPRVSAFVDDGRAFLEQADDRYDLILFALPDSLTVVTGQSSLRLESYLFTVEAMRAARDHLNPNGVFSVYNYYKPLVSDRLGETLSIVYRHAPCFDQGQGSGLRRQAVLTIGLRAGAVRCARTWREPSSPPLPATDNHPFPYLAGSGIPAFYLVTLVAILLATVLSVRTTVGRLGSLSPYIDLAFMGAAFLLLETKSVVQFALLFGTTWFVNALVFAGILLTVFGAVEVVRRVHVRRPWILYAGLYAALAVAWLVPQASLLALSPAVRFAAATALAFSPIFLANLIFATRFKEVGSSAAAFGANLLGAIVGGVVEYLALIAGYRALLLVVGLFYGAAFVTWRTLVVRRAAV